MAFIPFSFGERKCIGYNFANMIISSLIVKIINKLDFEFTDAELKEEHNFPIASAFQNHSPPVYVKVTSFKKEAGDT